MNSYRKITLLVMIVLNVMVLLGQIWPEGAPPFAKTINIVFLLTSLLYFLFALLSKRKD